MKKYRLLHTLSNDGGETILFLDADNTEPSEDNMLPGDTVEFDGIIKADLPLTFPVNCELTNNH